MSANDKRTANSYLTAYFILTFAFTWFSLPLRKAGYLIKLAGMTGVNGKYYECTKDDS